jgi:glutamate-5-semialdehyde dehydrogenase
VNLHEEMLSMGRRAVEASRQLLAANARKKNAILNGMADALDTHRDKIAEANEKDIAEATNAGLSNAMVDRLRLTPARMEGTIKGLRAVAGLKDPIGSRISRWIRPNGLEIVKKRVPIGVIGIIYESRPNVTVDTAALCLKTSNAVILRGGNTPTAPWRTRCWPEGETRGSRNMPFNWSGQRIVKPSRNWCKWRDSLTW